jgi:hypothetical protein
MVLCSNMSDKDDEITFVPDREEKDVQESIAEEVEQLQEDIKSDLEEIKTLTGDSKLWFWRGIMQGAGAIVGSILMIIFLGWFLSIIGVIPGLGEISEFFRGYVDRIPRY